MTREAMKPEEERVPLPEEPFAAVTVLPSLESMNEIALEAYRLRSSAMCPFCDRSFRDRDQLEKHNLMCTKTKPLHRAILTKDDWLGGVNRGETRRGTTSHVSCATCGRSFKHDYQLLKHRIACDANKPQQRRSFEAHMSSSALMTAFFMNGDTASKD